MGFHKVQTTVAKVCVTNLRWPLLLTLTKTFEGYRTDVYLDILGLTRNTIDLLAARRDNSANKQRI